MRANATHRQCPLSEYYNVHIQWLQMRWAVGILVETSETDKVVVTEQFNLFTRLLHLNVFRSQWMYRKNLDNL
jgi:hypothetical protein